MSDNKRYELCTSAGARLSRRHFLAAAGMGSLVFLDRVQAQESDAAFAQRPPNIVLIVADDLGYADLGVHGCRDVPTPNIDSIATNGVRFTNGYVSCPVCSPTRAGLLTGRYQQRFGHEFNPGPPTAENADFELPADERLFPEYLKEAGYATGMFGKWHLGYKDGSRPLDRGFGEFLGFLGGSHSYREVEEGPKQAILHGTEPIKEIEYTTDAFASEAAAFVECHNETPFFVYLPFNAVHTPLEAIDKYRARFESISDNRRRTFAAMLSAMDDGVGLVLSKLRKLGLEENTLVFFVSDNGGPTEQTSSRNDPLRGAKGQLYEGGIRVPFLMQWRGHVPAGLVYEKPVIALDILPTALKAAGVAQPDEIGLDGVDLMPFMTATAEEEPHEYLYWRHGEQWAVRNGDWKLVRPRGSESVELYHLPDDIAERKNLAGDAEDRVNELRAAYDAWNSQLAAPRWPQRDGQAKKPGERPKRAERSGKKRRQAREKK